MCGRYYSRGDKQRIADALKVGKMPPGYHLPADYNIAPSTFQPVIRPDRETGERELVPMRWGLVPAKIADPKAFKSYTTSNARAESILDKPIWKGPLTGSREACVRFEAEKPQTDLMPVWGTSKIEL